MAAPQQWDGHRLKELRIDVIDLNIHHTPIDADRCNLRSVTQRRTERQRYGIDTRESAEATLEGVKVRLRSGW